MLKCRPLCVQVLVSSWFEYECHCREIYCSSIPFSISHISGAKHPIIVLYLFLSVALILVVRLYVCF